ncbi:MAG: hypothetical protein WCC11_06975 [Gammaproteobacteria bacterium]
MKSIATLLLILGLCFSMLGCSKQNTPSSSASSDEQSSNVQSSDTLSTDAQASAPSSNWTYKTIPGNSFNPPVLTASTISTNDQLVDSNGSKHDIKLVLSNSTIDAADVHTAVEARIAVNTADAALKVAEKDDKAAYAAADAALGCSLAARFGIAVTNACAKVDVSDAGVSRTEARRDTADTARFAADDKANAAANSLAVADAAIDKDGMITILFDPSTVSCPSDCPMQIQVRVDNGSVRTLDAYLPGASAPGALFIKNPIDFLHQIEKANHIAFNIPMGGKYQEVDFDVSGLDTDKLDIK